MKQVSEWRGCSVRGLEKRWYLAEAKRRIAFPVSNKEGHWAEVAPGDVQRVKCALITQAELREDLGVISFNLKELWKHFIQRQLIHIFLSI